MSESGLSSSLVDTIATEGGVDLLAGLGEVTFDAMINQGLLRDVPVIGSLVQLVKLGFGVREYVFIRKLQKFATALKDVDGNQRDHFGERIERDKEFRTRVGENLILVIDRLDDMGKPELVGKAFAALMKDEIPYDTFVRISTTIDRVFLPDLIEFSRYGHSLEITKDWAQNLAAHGLLSTKVNAVWGPDDSKIFYTTTRLGKTLLRICFKR
jgi:hypothetical protein